MCSTKVRGIRVTDSHGCNTGPVPELWMLEDEEPWPNPPEQGTVFEATTFWAYPDQMDLPLEVCSEVEARIEEIAVDGRVERIAHLGHGFTTIVGDRDTAVGDVTLTGCLVWDRYLWCEYRTRPQGRLQLLERRGRLALREDRAPTLYPGMFSIIPRGPVTYFRIGDVPEGFGVRWNASTVVIVDEAKM